MYSVFSVYIVYIYIDIYRINCTACVKAEYCCIYLIYSCVRVLLIELYRCNNILIDVCLYILTKLLNDYLFNVIYIITVI